MTFGERLYKIRKDAGLSQEELAELMDVSRQSVSKWESDKAYPEMTRLLFISDYFHVTLDYLMRGNEEVQENEGKMPEKYTSEKMWVVWNTFTTNLTGMQKVLFTLGYTMAVAFMAVIVGTTVYELGYDFGRFLGKIIY